MRVLETKTLELLKSLNEGLILEASKKDILINKVGLSEKNAEILDELCGPLSVWMGNKMINYYKHYYGTLTNLTNELSPEELKVATIDKINDSNLVNSNKSKITSIMDWIRVGLNGNLGDNKRLSYPELIKESVKWHDELGVGDGDINYIEKNPIVLDFRDDEGNGFYWTDLETNDSSEECDRMGHCGRTNRNNTIYSLREVKPLNKKYKLNKSHLTAAIGENDGVLYQLKGPKNSKPKDEFHKYIEPIFYVLGGPGEEEDYLIQGFGSEYNSEDDFKLSDLPEESIRSIYRDRPELFDTRPLLRKLDEMGIIELPPINYVIKIETDANSLSDYIDGDWVINRRTDKNGRVHETTIFESILNGDTWELWDNWGADWKSGLDYYVDNDNEVRIKNYLIGVAKENEIDITDMDLKEMIIELDEDNEIKNSIVSSINDAEADSYVSYLYGLLKDAIEEYGPVSEMNSDDVTFTVDVEQFLSLDDEYNDDLYERCEDDITCVFDEMIGDGDIDKPSFSPDDRWYPDVDEKNFNEILSERLSEYI
jgi:hypothetical protein